MSPDTSSWTPQRVVGHVLTECEAISSQCDGGIVVGKLEALGWEVSCRTESLGIAELDAMQTAYDVLNDLLPDERHRALKWLVDRCVADGTEPLGR